MQKYPIRKLNLFTTLPKKIKERMNIKIDYYPKDKQIKKLSSYFEAIEKNLTFQNDPSGIFPEKAIVFEIKGTINNFMQVAKNIPEFEFLLEQDTYDENKKLNKLYAYMPTVASINFLLKTWKAWSKSLSKYGELEKGYKSWHNLFCLIEKIRAWGPKDRVVEEDVNFWLEQIIKTPGKKINIEVEFWFFENERKRYKIYSSFYSLINSISGEILDHITIKEISYHACLISVPAERIEKIKNAEDVHLIKNENIMFIRSQSIANKSQKFQSENAIHPFPESSKFMRKPIAALLDGVPVPAHELLREFIYFSDPDELSEYSPVDKREHGTKIASVIIHGDRNNPRETPIPFPLYIRPVMRWHRENNDEGFDNNRLLVDVIHKSIIKIKEESSKENITSDIFIVNLSLGDKNRPFANRISPWAKLLDFLAAKYNILFIVSAGNISHSLPLISKITWDQFKNSTEECRKKLLGLSLLEESFDRTIFSPAESMNALTIGAWHLDSNEQKKLHHLAFEPFENQKDFPNIVSALGLGYNKIVKPELFFPAGKELLMLHRQENGYLSINFSECGSYGIRCASPGAFDKETLCCGTSVSAAIATRSACQIFYSITDHENGAQLMDIEPKFYPVVIKSLLVHTSKWGNTGKLLYDCFPPFIKNTQRKDTKKHIQCKRNVTKILGYGAPNISEIINGDKNRITVVGCSEIDQNRDHIYKIPLPISLKGQETLRSITVTLSWFSPISSKFHDYKLFNLKISSPNGLENRQGKKEWEEKLGTSRIAQQPDHHIVNRGTLFHSHYEGEQFVDFFDDDNLIINISCSNKDKISKTKKISYGLVVTIKAISEIPIYEEISQKLLIAERINL